ncbi:MAG: methyltransferase domain-containing protein [Planctomycetota bacterium]
MTDIREYVLGTNEEELARLELQHSVWRDTSEGALDRAGIGPGASVLDLGCGPGFVTLDLAARVGASGGVVALDESPKWHEVLRARTFDAPVDLVEERIEDADLGEARFDGVFARWVLSFLADLDEVAERIARALRPGGAFVVQDYNHEGVSVFPRSEGFEAAIRATRAFYAGAGGDAWVIGRLPAALRRAGLEVEELRPVVRCGGPGSDAFRWADAFFPRFVDTYLDRGLMTAAERRAFDADWEAMRANPDALFFSPMVVEVIARRPG